MTQGVAAADNLRAVEDNQGAFKGSANQSGIAEQIDCKAHGL